MIDAKALAIELHQARLARIEAEAASCELEELIWQVRHAPPNWQRIAYVFDGFDQDTAAVAA